MIRCLFFKLSLIRLGINLQNYSEKGEDDESFLSSSPDRALTCICRFV